MLYTVSKTSNVSFKLFLAEIHPIPSVNHTKVKPAISYDSNANVL